MSYLIHLVLVYFSFLSIAFAETTFDVYGVDVATAKKILTCCSNNLRQYQSLLEQFQAGTLDNANKLLELQEATIKKIKQEGQFKLVKLTSVYYPVEQINYLTVDIVQQKDGYRIPKSPSRKISTKINKSDELQQLYNLWGEYNEHHLSLLRQGVYGAKNKEKCPALHCVWGFDEEDKNKYFEQFKQMSEHNKEQLTTILSQSNRDEDRGTAIFLLAHIKDYQFLANLLIDYVDDQSELVRNNSMRVLGAIIENHKQIKLPLKQIIRALNYPLVTDRNKAAYILLAIAQSNPLSHRQIITNAGPTLLALLNLKQPNNHDLAYQILKIISKKNFGPNEIQAWKNWLNNAAQKA